MRRGKSFMPNGYRKIPVKPFWLGELTGHPEDYFETKSTFTKGTRDSRFVKTLALCLTYAPAKLIYRNTNNPLMHQVRDMCRHGLLERYKRAGDRKYYYKTTSKGQDLLISILEK
jgi:hypothetical protein